MGFPAQVVVVSYMLCKEHIQAVASSIFLPPPALADAVACRQFKAVAMGIRRKKGRIAFEIMGDTAKSTPSMKGRDRLSKINVRTRRDTWAMLCVLAFPNEFACTSCIVQAKAETQ